MRKIAQLLYQAYLNQKAKGLSNSENRFCELEKKLLETFDEKQDEIYSEMDELHLQIEEEVQILAIQFVLCLLCPDCIE